MTIHSKRFWLLVMVSVIMLVQSGLGPAIADHAGDIPFRGMSLEAGRCNLIPVSNSTPVGVTGCGGVRPGSVISTFDGSTGGRCTINFLFQDTAGRRYAATAAHCVPGFYDPYGVTAKAGGDAVWGDDGPVARDAIGAPIGTFVYAFLGGSGGAPHDFALIKLNHYGTIHSNPGLCHFGGPVALNLSTTSSVTLLRLYGNGIAVGSVPARTAVAPFGLSDPHEVFADGPVASGDSGAPVIDADGRAVGVVVTLGAARTSGSPEAGTIGILRLNHMVERAKNKLGVRLNLLTAPAR